MRMLKSYSLSDGGARAKITPSPPTLKFRSHNLADSSGVSGGSCAFRASIKIKSFPSPSYLAILICWRSPAAVDCSATELNLVLEHLSISVLLKAAVLSVGDTHADASLRSDIDNNANADVLIVSYWLVFYCMMW
mmetsp:Transcript_26356/g.39511  ORF Transcript_26356/g.39511 Transcript_26356/m.39511 type:complete len:135 (-) Transcript_26356:49-453(-)